MSAINESIMQRTTLGQLVEHYGWDLVPAFASGVTITSLASDVESVTPGELVILGDDADVDKLPRARARGAYAALVPPSTRGALLADADLPLLFANPTSQQLGLLTSRMAGNPSASLAVFAVCGSTARQNAAVVSQLTRFLHMLGNPVGMLSVAGSYSLERDLNLTYPLNMLDVQRSLAVCSEDGVAAVAVSLDDLTISAHGMQAVNVDVLGSMQPVPPNADQAFIERLQDEYGFRTENPIKVTVRTLESDALARQAAGALSQEDEQRLSLAIAMVLAAGVHRTNIRSALRMAKELQ